jgi:hypothetical protein
VLRCGRSIYQCGVVSGCAASASDTVLDLDGQSQADGIV